MSGVVHDPEVVSAGSKDPKWTSRWVRTYYRWMQRKAARSYSRQPYGSWEAELGDATRQDLKTSRPDPGFWGLRTPPVDGKWGESLWVPRLRLQVETA